MSSQDQGSRPTTTTTGEATGGVAEPGRSPNGGGGHEGGGSASGGAIPNRRAAIEEAALGLFLDRGFAATSVREITAAVGVTVPALYYHFGSKDGLLAALVQGLVDDGEAVLDDLAARSGRRLPARALASYYDVVTGHLDVFRLVMVDPSVRSHHLAGHRLAEQAGRFLDLLTGGRSGPSELVRANAALGAIRRPLRLPEVDVVADRAQILASARAALAARP
jgi:AcrR family transcriptional regulator